MKEANMLKKSINSAGIRLSHVNAAAAMICVRRKRISLLATAARSLPPQADPPEEDRLWIFFSTSGSCFQIEYAKVR